MKRYPNRAYWFASVAVLAVVAGAGALIANTDGTGPAEPFTRPGVLELVAEPDSPRITEVDSESLAKPAPPGRVSLLVYMDEGLRQDARERADLKSFAGDRGAIVRYEYKLVPNLLNLRNVAVEDVDRIEQMPGVARVEIDEYHEYVLQLDESTPHVRGLQSQLNAAGIFASV